MGMPLAMSHVRYTLSNVVEPHMDGGSRSCADYFQFIKNYNGPNNVIVFNEQK